VRLTPCVASHHPSAPAVTVSLYKCPSCGRGMKELQVQKKVMSRLHTCTSCKVVWFVFGDRLFRCANVSALLVPGQL
jgi:hypothetical protein